MKKRRLAVWMLTASMVFTLFPTTAFAAKMDGNSGNVTGDESGGRGEGGVQDNGSTGSGQNGGNGQTDGNTGGGQDGGNGQTDGNTGSGQDGGNGQTDGNTGGGQDGGNGQTDGNTGGGQDDGNGHPGNGGGRPDGGGQGNGGGRPDGGSGGGRGEGGGREEGGGKEEVTYSDTIITIPEEIADGNYTGTATVVANEEGDFDDYGIEVTVTFQDGQIVSISVTGSDGAEIDKENKIYASMALSGVKEQILNKLTDNYEVDVVSTATCSSHAIVQAINAAIAEGVTLSGTYYTMDSAINYDPNGSYLEVTVHNPEEGTTPDDYAITLVYGSGKFSDELEDTDKYCSVKLVSADEKAFVYGVTMNPESDYKIYDDDITHHLYFNDPGTSLSINVNGIGIGTFLIKATAVPSITNNVLSLIGGNGETLEKYLSLINTVKVTYEDENGEEVKTEFETVWHHDIEAAFDGEYLFNEDGSINFNLVAKVTVLDEEGREAAVDENGNNITENVPVFPKRANGDYYIEITAGNGFEVVSANVGASYVAKAPETDATDNGSNTSNPTDNGGSGTSNPAGSNGSGTSDPANSNGSGSSASKPGSTTGNTSKTTATTTPKTSDNAAPFLWFSVIAVAAGGIVVTRKKVLR